MFKSLKRITYQVLELEKAKEWYINILNTQPVLDTPVAAIFIVGDCSLSLAQGKNPLPENSERMEVYWEVDDIDQAYQKLLDSGAQSLVPVRQVLNIKIGKVIDPFFNVIGLSGKIIEVDKKKKDGTKRRAGTFPVGTLITIK